MGQVAVDGQARGFGDQAAGDVRGTDGVLGQDAAVGDAELDHEFLLAVLCHEGDVHVTDPLSLSYFSKNRADMRCYL